MSWAICVVRVVDGHRLLPDARGASRVAGAALSYRLDIELCHVFVGHADSSLAVIYVGASARVQSVQTYKGGFDGNSQDNRGRGSQPWQYPW